MSTDWLERFKSAGIIWQYPGPPHPHLRLSSGLHSAEYFNAEILVRMEYTQLFLEVCRELAGYIVKTPWFSGVNHIVVPSSKEKETKSAAELIAFQTWEYIRNGGECTPDLSVLRVPIDKSGETKKVLDADVICLPTSRGLLFLDDAWTTGSTYTVVKDAFKRTRRSSCVGIAVVVNRSNSSEHDGMPIISLLERMMPTWPADSCPLCANSVALLAGKLFGHEGAR